LIIRLMRQRDAWDRQLRGSARQELVAHLARSHFQREMVRPGNPPHLGPLNPHWQSQPLCGEPNQPFIRVTAWPAQLVIQMGHG